MRVCDVLTTQHCVVVYFGRLHWLSDVESMCIIGVYVVNQNEENCLGMKLNPENCTNFDENAFKMGIFDMISQKSSIFEFSICLYTIKIYDWNKFECLYSSL